ncbi:hypothetical protein MHBO_003003, partial [Bonamia ostreae]
MNTENDELQKGSLRYKMECDRLRERLTEFDQLQVRYNELERRISEALGKAAQSDQLNNKYVEKIKELQDIIGQRDTNIRLLETRNAQMCAADDSVANDIHQYQTTLLAYKQENDRLNTKIIELENRVIELEEDLRTRIEAAKEAAASTAVQIDGLLNDTQKLEAVKISLEGQLRDRETDCDRLTKQLGECEQLRVRCNELERRISEMAELVAERDQRIEQLNIERTDNSDDFSNQTE